MIRELPGRQEALEAQVPLVRLVLLDQPEYREQQVQPDRKAYEGLLDQLGYKVHQDLQALSMQKH